MAPNCGIRRRYPVKHVRHQTRQDDGREQTSHHPEHDQQDAVFEDRCMI